MENKHSKFFIVRQSKSLKFTSKMRQNTFDGWAPIRNEGPTSGRRGGEGGEGRKSREGGE